MGGFICLKSISLSGTQFIPGERIPAESILPSRVLALKRSGYIAEAEREDATTPSKMPQNSDFDNYPIEIPIITSEGLLAATVGSKSVYKALSILQLPDKEAKEEISGTTDDDALMIVNAVEKRKGVLSAVKERHEFLTAEGGDQDGQDV